ncbi:cysteine desulfurase [Mangrovimonas yunxiaonensis]|uniref:cysteine desulfurase n=1 Tax=Mangrovimonas yunxiaonensis TaxID=1197477 RepID=A0A084TN10_9FLAO|nr:cysteine desulfurase family protein [Mangrovimonas yunxiaonensis]KFB02096.1 cysteine desulfurase [Mangrovimonas yunxiaonensis]MBR9757042.1 cysteine desulfurase [Algicola sp.]GGH47961.1 cysteine desulfurase [Mangrovimonas yunxiaonensis]
MKSVYLDSAATTQVREEVINDIQDVLSHSYGNPSSTHAFGRASKTIVETTRKTIAKYLNALPQEIIFTSGGTEADNMILRCAVRDGDVKTIITSAIEHHAVLHTVEELKSEYGIRVAYVKLQACGTPDYDHLEQLLAENNDKKLVSLMHVNNEVGNILDIQHVAALCKAHNALFHSDTVQSIGHYEWDVQQIPIDFMTAAAHKFHGPKGVGFAYIRKDSNLKPLIFGGAQERGYRAGTESVHNIKGLETAFKLAYDNLNEERTYVQGLKDYFKSQLEAAIPAVKFNGNCHDNTKSTYTLINACLPMSPEKALTLPFQLDLKGIACSKGSACQSGSGKGSHVLDHILSEEDKQKPSIRFSFSKFNTKEEIDYVVAVLKEFVAS